MMTAPEPDGIVWHTSRYSANGEACVEVGWRTSSYCDKCEACVEVAPTSDAVLIRDSKHRTGPALTIPPTAWHAFLTTLTR
jgi:ferredoxin